MSIVVSGQYEDDQDNYEEIVYTGQGGNDLLGNKRQIKDQVMERGNLGLKVCFCLVSFHFFLKLVPSFILNLIYYFLSWMCYVLAKTPFAPVNATLFHLGCSKMFDTVPFLRNFTTVNNSNT